MADKFLNLTGLSYFWSKITSALSLKQDTLTAGTGIDINNGLIKSQYAQLSSPDLNTIDYTFAGYVVSSTNKPTEVSSSGYLINVIRNTNTNYRFQLYAPYDKSICYVRNYNNGTWGNWTELQNILSAGDGIKISNDTIIADLGFSNVNVSNMTIPNNTVTKVLESVELPAGKYIFNVRVAFSSNASGIRQVSVSETEVLNTNVATGLTQTAVSGDRTTMNGLFFFQVSTPAIYYVMVKQNSGSDISASAYFRYTKLGDVNQ